MTTFILVHGTFANAADWPALQSALTNEVNPSIRPVRFVQISWTGKNRARARQSAADTICLAVNEIRARSISETIFIIGHSHGGSAIAYFLKAYPEVAKTITGCAFLSTPFVAMRPRVQAIPICYSICLAICGFILSFIAQALLNAVKFLEAISPFLPVGIYFGLIALVAIIIMSSRKIAARRAPEYIEKSISEQTADLPDGNYLFMRASGDEAAIALSATQFIASVRAVPDKIDYILS